MRTTSQRLTKNLCVRISEADDLALAHYAQRMGQTKRTKVVRQLIAEASGTGPYLLGNDLNALRESVREVRAVGINLNQLMRAINSGQVTLPTTSDLDCLLQLSRSVEAVRKELNAMILRSRNRGTRYGL